VLLFANIQEVFIVVLETVPHNGSLFKVPGFQDLAGLADRASDGTVHIVEEGVSISEAMLHFSDWFCTILIL
jgi:hypothetical protein